MHSPKDTKRQHPPQPHSFTLPPSGKRYRSICCHSTRLQSTFFPQAPKFILCTPPQLFLLMHLCDFCFVNSVNRTKTTRLAFCYTTLCCKMINKLSLYLEEGPQATKSWMECLIITDQHHAQNLSPQSFLYINSYISVHLTNYI